ncbi:MAG: hypothetical protein ABIL09_16095 [Gemmatimonadota bacterium]
MRCLLWQGNDVGIYRWELASFKDTTFKTLEETVLRREGLVASHNLVEREIRLVNGSVIRYGGLKPSESASRDILKIAKSLEHNAVYVDEATDVPQAVFEFIQTRVPRRKCRNSLTGRTEFPPGAVRVTCNPEVSYLKTIFIDRPRPGYEFVRAIWRDNRENLPVDYERTAFGHMSLEWQARYRDGDWRAAVDSEALCPPELLHRAVDLGRRASGWGDCEMGVDVASSGDDLSVVVMRRGAKAEVLYERNEPNILVFSGLVGGYARVHRPRLIKVDAVGLGEGVWRDLEREGLPVMPMIGGAKPDDETGNYRNQRAEIYWHLRKLLQEGRVALPDHPEMINELGVIRYSQTASGQTIQVESKKEIKKRLGHSPDLADAVVYAYAYSTPAFASILV